MKRALLFVAAIVILLGASETLLRLYGFGRGIRYRAHPQLGWEMIPGQDAFNVRGRARVRVNRHGFRGPEVAVTRPASGLRLLFLGDGTTINNQTPEDETFPFLVTAQLQRQLPERTVETLVGAVSGYQLEQYLELLRLSGPKLEPDVVVVGFCWNDWEPDTMRGPNLGPMAFGEYAGGEGKLERTAIADFGNRLARIWARRRQTQAHARGEKLPEANHDALVWAHVSSSLDSIAALAGSIGSDLVLLVLPARMTKHDPAAFLQREQQLREWASRTGTTYVHPLPEFAAAEARGARLFLDELHLAPEAQPLVASALLEALDSSLRQPGSQARP